MKEFITFVKIEEVFFPDRCYELRFTPNKCSDLDLENLVAKNNQMLQMPRDQLVIFKESLFNFIKWSLDINNSDWRDFVYPSLTSLESWSNQLTEMMQRRLEQMRELICLLNAITILLES